MKKSEALLLTVTPLLVTFSFYAGAAKQKESVSKEESRARIREPILYFD